MPAQLSYPGVYIEEIPSGVRTITGVATSITAFVGRAGKGPVNEPVTCTSFGDFERTFGGVQKNYLMSYAVRDFFLNGGSTAIVVRLMHPNFPTDAAANEALTALPARVAAAKAVADAATGADVAAAKAAAQKANDAIQGDAAKSAAEKQAAKAVFDAVSAAAGKAGATLADLTAAAKAVFPGELPAKARIKLRAGDPTAATADWLLLEAASQGRWGNTLAARVDVDGIVGVVGDRFKAFGLTEADLFNLTVRDTQTGASEQYRNVTWKPNNPRGVDTVLANGSNLVRVQALSQDKPIKTDDVLTSPLQDTIKQGQAAGATQEQKDKAAAAQKTLDQLSKPFNPADDSRYIGVLDADVGKDGGYLTTNDVAAGAGLQDNKRGLYALDKADLFNLLCIPPDIRGGDTDPQVYSDALAYCVYRRAMLLVDSPAAWSSNKDTAASQAKTHLGDLNLSGQQARNAALFFPRVIQADPQRDGVPDTFAPCGIIAGVMARTDTTRGVWKAPAGLDAALNGIQALELNLTDAENGLLNPLGINCLRLFPAAGRVVWGARTLRGNDQLADEYKYIPVRRLALYIEESLYRGTQWVVFEPNDEPLWAQIRLNVGAFMHNLFRQGAFQGSTPRDAYFVKCDKETTLQNDIDLGIVNIVVGFAPLKPAEFVVIKLQQMAGQIEV